MNGGQDLGGRMGFGAVVPETGEPLFHAAWEKRALALTLCAGAMGHWTLDESRHARETLHPVDYLSLSYYEIWIKGLETLLERHGFVSAADRAAGRAVTPSATPKRVLVAAAVPALLARGGPTSRPAVTSPRFSAGDRVRTSRDVLATHTRLPGYARNAVATIETWHGAHVFPDTNAHGLGENPAHLYTIAFSATELFGRAADPGVTVSIDAFEPYLEPV